MIFLKLGGSLITDKERPETSRPAALRRLAGEIAAARADDPALRLLLGHGSGSFGHSAAARYGTHRGARTTQEWLGFAEVWSVAGRLSRQVVDALREAGLPAMAFPPSASAVCHAGELVELAVEPIRGALEHGLVAVVAGDVALDRAWGTTILSTERVFAYLAPQLRPQRLLLAGLDPGVYAGFPHDRTVLPELREADLERIQLAGAQATDVTGGMADKVRHALRLARLIPGLEVRIFSGERAGAVLEALRGGAPGTLILPE